jgi:DNA polymerase-3 subunit delta
MLHILYGPDSFSRGEALAALKRTLDTDGMLASNTTALDARSLTLQHLQMVCGAAPFLAASRLVIVEGLLGRLSGGASRRGRRGSTGPALPEEWKALPDMVAQMPSTTTLVFVDGDLPAESSLVQALAEHGRARNFPRLPARAIEGWIAQRAKAQGVNLDSAALRLFAESVTQDVGDDGQWHALWGVAGDLEKLSLYAGGRTVTVEDVRRLVPAAVDTNVFAFVDAVIERRGEEALRRLSDLLVAGQPAPVLLTMLVRGYRNVVLYVDLAASGSRPEEIGRRLNLPRFALERLSRQAARYQLPRLAGIYDRILQADRSIKRGESDETAAIEILTAELAGVG